MISRREFFTLSIGTVSGLLVGGMFGKIKSLFTETEKVSGAEEMYKLGEKVPRAGKYQCVVCKLIVEYLPKHIEKGVTFDICTVCRSGTEKGPKKPHEEFWKYIG